MKIKSIHVCLEVGSYKRAMKFYKPLFSAAGFKKGISDNASYGGFTNGNMTVFIGESQPRRVMRKAPTGEEFVVMDHVGFSVAKKADVDTLDKAMRKAGFKPLFPAQVLPEFGPGFYAVTYRDRDNNVLEFGHRG